MKKCLYCDEMINDNKKVCNKNYCKEKLTKFNKPPNTECSYCGIEFYIKPYRLKRVKNMCCSKECDNNLRKLTMLGENNHQYGLKGNLNSS